ncbi:MAG: AAA family ATPase [Candidatus Aenigmarchaeota archaeon]|nr:AAA family ATPase [Candidatus Aenigmarchaeota archaeon]
MKKTLKKKVEKKKIKEDEKKIVETKVIENGIERISTGIEGLDEIIEGGYPKNSVILVSGGPGTGKTLFCLQYLYNGAKNGEFGIYLTFEEEPKDLKDAAKRVGIDLEATNKVKIIKIENIVDVPQIIKILEEEIKKNDAKRLVIDSISSLEILASTFPSVGLDVSPIKLKEGYVITPQKEAIIRKFLYNLVKYLRSLKVTTILTSEAQNEKYSRSGVIEFIADGVIKLSAEAVGNVLERNLFVVKMRKTKIEGGSYRISIEKGGIRIVER